MFMSEIGEGGTFLSLDLKSFINICKQSSLDNLKL